MQLGALDGGQLALLALRRAHVENVVAAVAQGARHAANEVSTEWATGAAPTHSLLVESGGRLRREHAFVAVVEIKGNVHALRAPRVRSASGGKHARAPNQRVAHSLLGARLAQLLLGHTPSAGVLEARALGVGAPL